jgi:REP element-mobilizing transposase RayT
MPQSLSAVYVHLVFSTKDRKRYLQNAELRNALHAYIGAISKNLNCSPIRVGGVEDHVHVLANLARDITIGNWVKEVKRLSSIWLKTQSTDLQDFRWQRGYSCFSVSRSNLEAVTDYINRQVEHHVKMTYEDEVRALLMKHDIAFDEQYVWD